MISSPCVKKCELDEQGQFCLGCFRTLTELRQWRKMSELERKEIMEKISKNSPKTISAYQCPDCLVIHIDFSDCQKCLDKHEKDRQIVLQEKLERAALKEKLDQFRLNLDSFSKFEVRLIEMAELLGYDLVISDFRGRVRIHKDSWSKDVEGKPTFLGSISGRFGPTPDREQIPPFRSRSSKKTSYFPDFISYYFSGIETGTGGGGDKFSYEIRMKLENFPLIQAKYDLFLELSEKKKEYDKKRKLLQEEYEEYYHWKKFSDITWIVHDKEKDELKARLKEIEVIQNERAKALDDEREARTRLNPDFDLALLEKISIENNFTSL